MGNEELNVEISDENSDNEDLDLEDSEDSTQKK